MARTRDKIQQQGFWDVEVSNPDHDTVCMWAYENAEAIFRAAYPDLFDRDWNQNDLQHISMESTEMRELAAAFLRNTARPNPRITKRSWEYVLKSYTGRNNDLERIVGYADLLIETAVPHIAKAYAKASTRYGDDVFVGFELGWKSDDWGVPRILVEAKSKLPTRGELMRQIQLYRTAFRGRIVVVSPDDNYAQLLAEQDITFVWYPGFVAQGNEKPG